MNLPLTDCGQRIIRDRTTRGFGVVVGKTTRSYFAERLVTGRNCNRRIIIGRVGQIAFDEARIRAQELIAAMARGIDPQEQKAAEIHEHRRKSEEALRNQITLRDLWEEFRDDRELVRKARTIDGYENFMESAFAGKKIKRRDAIYPDWMARPAKEISRAEVMELHRRMGAESGRAYANAAFRVLSSIFNFGITRGRVTENPVTVLRREWFRVNPRKSVIPDNKLSDWFRAVNDLRYDAGYPNARVGMDFLEFALFTGLRRNEAARLKWQNVELDRGTMTIPETKNHDPLTLPLSAHLVAMLERRKADAGGSPWVFPSPGRKGNGKPLAEPRYATDLIEEAIGIRHSIHDLRRTFISAAARVVPYAVVKALVNHRAAHANDITLDYVSLSVDELRPHVDAIAGHFLGFAAKGQGMRLVIAQ